MTQKWEFRRTEIEGLTEIRTFNADDVRGSFTKDYSVQIFAENKIHYEIKEVFYTTNQKGVLRGLHFQRVKQQQKLIRCLSGHIWDVVVDLRPDSPTFKKWLAFDLIGEKHNELLIPTGCAHGFLALEPSIACYKCDEVFYPQYDDGIFWNDPEIGIAWPIEKIGRPEDLILSEKDKNLRTFAQKFGTGGGKPVIVVSPVALLNVWLYARDR